MMGDESLLGMVLSSGPVVQGVLYLLIFFSVRELGGHPLQGSPRARRPQVE